MALSREELSAAEAKALAADKAHLKKPVERPGVLCWTVLDGKLGKWTSPQRVRGDALKIAGYPAAAAFRDRIHIVAHNTITDNELFHMVLVLVFIFCSFVVHLGI